MAELKPAKERLQKVLEATGHAAKRSLGQNFLVSDAIIRKILQAGFDARPSALIEVGPGPGALTEGLKQIGVPLTLIELDTGLAEYWRSQGMTVVEADALQMDWAPLISEGRTVLVSNLPYQISSSLVIERSIAEKPDVAAMVLMFQKEVAQRLRAMPSTEHYGMLSVLAQNFWRMETVCDAGPADFQPPPRVASRVLRFERLESSPAQPARFLSFCKAAFAQRRKLLKSNLGQWLRQKGATEEALLAKLAEFGLKETARAEELSPARFRELHEYLDRSGK